MRNLDAIARDHAEMAIDTLVEVASDADNKPSDRVAASNAILDRGYGKPIAATVSLPADSERVAELAHMSDVALLAAVHAGRLARGVYDTGGTPQSEGPTPLTVRDTRIPPYSSEGTPQQKSAPGNSNFEGKKVPNDIRRGSGLLLASIEAPTAPVDPLAL